MPTGTPTLIPIYRSSCSMGLGDKGRQGKDGDKASDPQSWLWDRGSQCVGGGRALGFLRLWNLPGSHRNPHTLVEVTSFAAINKFQPFNVAVSSNVLFLLVCAQLLRCPGAQGLPGWGGAAPCPEGLWNRGLVCSVHYW